MPLARAKQIAFKNSTHCKQKGNMHQALKASASAASTSKAFTANSRDDSLQQGSCLKEWPTATGYITARNLTATPCQI